MKAPHICLPWSEGIPDEIILLRQFKDVFSDHKIATSLATRLIDMSGTEFNPPRKASNELDTSQIPTGIYLLVFFDLKGQISHKELVVRS